MTKNQTSFKKGHVVSSEVRRKISEKTKGIQKRNIKIINWNKGKKFSDEHKRKISESQKGIPRPYSRLKKGIKMSEESREKMSISARGKKLSDSTKRKISVFQKARYLDINVRKQLSDKLKKIKYNKKGQEKITLNKQIRGSFEYRLWRNAVFERDEYTCVFCKLKFIKGVTGNIRLEVDHIKPFSLYPELRFAIDNGRTLCKKCHISTDTYGGKLIKNKL